MIRVSLAVLACLVGQAVALSIPFQKRMAGVHEPRDASDPFNFMNVNNQTGFDIYVVTLSVEGRDYEVQLDTGSSDLWLDTTGVQLTTFQDTGVNQIVPYGGGGVAQGPIEIGNVTLGPYTVTQALISAPGTNATSDGDKGLLGVGPPGTSQISIALNATTFQGKTVMENIFAANPSLPPYFTVDLSRSATMGSSNGGTFTIGETRSDLSAISNAPKLPIVDLTRWITLLDGIVVSGQTFAPPITNYNVPGQLPTQLVTLLDTGGPFAIVPKMYLDAIYGNVPGGQFVEALGQYVIPCDTVIDVSFVFGGVAYPIHPLDSVVGMIDPQLGIYCVSGFIFLDLGTSNAADTLLGVTFLRNVYALFDFGNLVSGTDAPFIQLLATTDTSTAAAEFQSLSAQRNASLMALLGHPSSSPTPAASGGSGAGAKSGASRNVGLSIVLSTVAGIALGIALALR